MQRNSTYPFALKGFSLFLLYLLYESLGNIYLFLPPLFGVLFFYFIRALDRQDVSLLLLVMAMLLLYEADKGYLFFSSCPSSAVANSMSWRISAALRARLKIMISSRRP